MEWGRAEFTRAEVVAAAVEKIAQKYDKAPETLPPRTGTASTSKKDTSKGAIPKVPKAPVDKKEGPDYYCKNLDLEGTQFNNRKARALKKFSMDTFNKQLAGVRFPLILYTSFPNCLVVCLQ